MWTHSIVSTKYIDGKALVKVQFLDDSTGTGFQRDYFPSSLDNLKRQIKNQLDKIVTDEALLASVSEDMDLTTSPEPEPTLKEQAQNLWLRRYRIYLRIQEGINAGIFTGLEDEISQLKTWLKINFKPEYLEQI